MEHGQHGICLGQGLGCKSRVCRQWPEGSDTRCTGDGNGRCNDGRIFVPQMPPFTGMRVQAEHGDTRLGDPEAGTQAAIENM